MCRRHHRGFAPHRAHLIRLAIRQKVMLLCTHKVASSGPMRCAVHLAPGGRGLANRQANCNEGYRSSSHYKKSCYEASAVFCCWRSFKSLPSPTLLTPAERLRAAAGLPEAGAPRPAGPECRHPAEHHLAAAAPHRQRLGERPPAAVAARRRRPSSWAAGRKAAVDARQRWRLDPSSQEGALAEAFALLVRPCTSGLADLGPVPLTRRRRHRAALTLRRRCGPMSRRRPTNDHSG